jgi:hypothetical protein
VNVVKRLNFFGFYLIVLVLTLLKVINWDVTEKQLEQFTTDLIENTRKLCNEIVNIKIKDIHDFLLVR